MHVTFICLIVIHYVCLLEVNAVYNKDITCIIDKDEEPVCKVSPKVRRRSSSNIQNPSHDPYIPRNDAILYNCSTECFPVTFTSMTELTHPNLFLTSCYKEITEEDDHSCEIIRYNHFKHIDKLLFLSKTIPRNIFYLVDCLIYPEGGRVCHSKDDSASHVDLVHAGNAVRPNTTYVLSQDEFLCEEDEARNLRCDLILYVPLGDGLEIKKGVNFNGNVVLKRNSTFIPLKPGCIRAWCGYIGQVSPSRRSAYPYNPPGGTVFRCFYAHSQQVCKPWSNPQQVYNHRGWL